MQVLFFTVHIFWRGGCSHLTAGCVMKWRHAALLYLPAPLSLFIMLLKVYVWMNLINIYKNMMQTSFITAREALLSDLNSSWTIFPMQYSLLCSDSEHWGRSRYRYGSSKDTCMLSRHRCRCRYVWCWNRYQSTLLKKQFPFHLEQVSCLMSSWEWIFSARNICCQVMFCCCCFCLTAVWI